MIRLTVYSTSVHLLIVGTGVDYVSVTWVGIEPTAAGGSARYVVVYRPLSANETRDKRPQVERFILENDYDYLNDDDDRDVDGDGGGDYDDETMTKVRRLPLKIPAKVSGNRTWCTSSASFTGECLNGVYFGQPTAASAADSAARRRSYRKMIDIRPYMRGYWVHGRAVVGDPLRVLPRSAPSRQR